MHYIVVNSPILALGSTQMLKNALPFPVIGLVYALVIDRNTTQFRAVTFCCKKSSSYDIKIN